MKGVWVKDFHFSSFRQWYQMSVFLCPSEAEVSLGTTTRTSFGLPLLPEAAGVKDPSSLRSCSLTMSVVIFSRRLSLHKIVLSSYLSMAKTRTFWINSQMSFFLDSKSKQIQLQTLFSKLASDSTCRRSSPTNSASVSLSNLRNSSVRQTSSKFLKMKLRVASASPLHKCPSAIWWRVRQLWELMCWSSTEQHFSTIGLNWRKSAASSTSRMFSKSIFSSCVYMNCRSNPNPVGDISSLTVSEVTPVSLLCWNNALKYGLTAARMTLWHSNVSSCKESTTSPCLTAGQSWTQVPHLRDNFVHFKVIWGGLRDLGSNEPNWCKPNQSTYRQHLPKVCVQKFHGQDEDWFGIFWALVVYFGLGIMRKEGICQIWNFVFLRSKSSNLEVQTKWGIDVEISLYLRRYKYLVKEVYWWNIVYCMEVWEVVFDFWFLKKFL